MMVAQERPLGNFRRSLTALAVFFIDSPRSTRLHFREKMCASKYNTGSCLGFFSETSIFFLSSTTCNRNGLMRIEWKSDKSTHYTRIPLLSMGRRDDASMSHVNDLVTSLGVVLAFAGTPNGQSHLICSHSCVRCSHSIYDQHQLKVLTVQGGSLLEERTFNLPGEKTLQTSLIASERQAIHCCRNHWELGKIQGLRPGLPGHALDGVR